MGWTPLVGSPSSTCQDALKEALNWAGIGDTMTPGPEWWEHGLVPYPTPLPVPFGFQEDCVQEGVEIAAAAPGVDHAFTYIIYWQGYSLTHLGGRSPTSCSMTQSHSILLMTAATESGRWIAGGSMLCAARRQQWRPHRVAASALLCLITGGNGQRELWTQEGCG